ncbi:MAG: OmpA family protein [Deltaproteobacteria bacterium]|nr:OmpA family protein [Deltaproteobacteria bacterium]MBK8011780.1 OmpA family protein [Deltaproteobacteria bacterium]
MTTTTHKQGNSRTAFAAVLIAAIGAGCASTSSLTRDDVFRQYDGAHELNAGLLDAQARNSSLLAPEQYRKTEALLDDAVHYAQNAEKDKANQATQAGLEELDVLRQAVDTNGRVMEEVMATRDRADEQGASGLFEVDFAKADADFADAARLLERNRFDHAVALRPALIQTYAALELRAIKKGLVAAAADAIKKAESVHANDYAPKTLIAAKQKLQLATAVLDADRSHLDKSNAHARSAIWFARRAAEITAVGKWFEQQDFAPEDILLWYQAQLQQVRQPLTSGTLPFDRSNAEVVATLKDDVASLVQSTQDLREAHRLGQERIQSLNAKLEELANARRLELEGILASHEKQLAALRSGNQAQIQQAKLQASQQVTELQGRLSRETTERDAAARRESEGQARYENVRVMFSADEADVFRQGPNVLIRLKGFGFRPGKAEIDSNNFALLNKVILSLNIFPKGRVTVSGHSDSTGAEETNLALSRARATSVAKFLTTVGKIPSNQITSEGRGENAPIASNDTSAGRAMNRRIDVSIEN